VGQPHADTTWRSKIAFQSNGRAAFVAASSAGWSSGTESGTAIRRCRILAPVTVKERDLQSGEEPGERKPFLRTVFVFVRAQLGGAPVGAGGARSAERARDRRLARPPDGSAAGIAESRGFRVSLKPAPGRATGGCDPSSTQSRSWSARVSASRWLRDHPLRRQLGGGRRARRRHEVRRDDRVGCAPHQGRPVTPWSRRRLGSSLPARAARHSQRARS
jgi:hypothetical protein